MKRVTTVVLTAEDLDAMVANCEQGSVQVKVPRKEGGELSAVITVSAEDFQSALSATLDVDVADLDEMEISNKKDGGISVSW